MTPPIAGQTILVVEEGFNLVGYTDPDQAVTDPVLISRFDANTQKVLNANAPFTLVLGESFESAYASVNLPCAGLAAVAQLTFLQSRQLARIVMKRPHDVLKQNALNVGLSVVADPESWQEHIKAATCC